MLQYNSTYNFITLNWKMLPKEKIWLKNQKTDHAKKHKRN